MRLNLTNFLGKNSYLKFNESDHDMKLKMRSLTKDKIFRIFKIIRYDAV